MALHKVIVASAGAGKTTRIVEEVLANSGEPALITTYTNENCEEIRRRFYEINGHIPAWVDIKSWYQFLLSDGVRPYQRYLYESARIESVYFPSGEAERAFYEARRFAKKSEVNRHFIVAGNLIAHRFTSEFAVACDHASKGAVVGRLSAIYRHIYIDEAQDMAGYDMCLIRLLFNGSAIVTIVCDPRQYTYDTAFSKMHSNMSGDKILKFFTPLEKQGICTIEHLAISHRCHNDICRFADALYPEYPSTKSLNGSVHRDMGVHIVSLGEVKKYTALFAPVVLVNDRREHAMGLPSRNIGGVKGKTFDRVLVFDTGPIRKYLETGDKVYLQGKSNQAVAKLYVAATRARHSVGIVYRGTKEALIVPAWANTMGKLN